jgi:solute carrier family 25 (adenine nucleotide translocator) protein 4/5/6/31
MTDKFQQTESPALLTSSVNFSKNFLAGGFSAAIAKTATAPIERVKLIVQTQDANKHIKSGEVLRYTGIVNCFSRIYKEQGLKAFWRGNFTNVIRYFPTQAFNFAFKDSIKSMFPKYSSKDNFGRFVLVNVFSGGLAGAGSLCIVYPLDYARTRLASDVGKGRQTFSGLADCLAKTSKGPRGWLALYNGFGVSVLGIIPYRGVYFGMYDSLAGLNPYREDNSLVGLAAKFAVAQVTAITAGYASYPIDTVRRRLQMQSELPRDQWNYTGTADCFRRIFKEEGLASFWKGAGANVIRTIGAALVLVMYGEAQRLMGNTAALDTSGG